MPVAGKVRKYAAAAARGDLDFKDIPLEMASDRLLAGTGLTTEAAETKRRRRPRTVSLDSVAGLRAPVDLGDDPEDDARRALEVVGSPRERFIYGLYSQNWTTIQIADTLHISASTVRVTLSSVRRRLREYLSRYEAWREVLVAEITRRPLPVNLRAEERRLEKAVARLKDEGWTIQSAGTDEDGDPLFELDSRYLLRADQMVTLDGLGCVRTTRYGLIKKSRVRD